MEKSLSTVRDVDLKILMELDDKSLLSFCSTSKYGKLLCENEDFWRQRFNLKFPQYGFFKSKKRTWKDFYLAMVYYINKYDLIYERIKGNIRLKNEKYEPVFYEIAKGGMKNLDLINAFLSYLNTNWKLIANFGIQGAQDGGHQDLAELFRSRSK